MRSPKSKWGEIIEVIQTDDSCWFWNGREWVEAKALPERNDGLSDPPLGSGRDKPQDVVSPPESEAGD